MLPAWATWKVIKIGIIGLAFGAVLAGWGVDHMLQIYKGDAKAASAALSADMKARGQEQALCTAKLAEFTRDINETANTSIAVGDEAAERTKMLAEKMSNAELCRNSQFCRNNKGSVGGD